MIEEHAEVGLVVERRIVEGKWEAVAWQPVAVLPGAPELAAWTPLGGTGKAMRYYAGAQTLTLYSTDTANYRDNLETGTPKLWVVLTPTGPDPPVDVVTVTADPAEGEAGSETGTNVVDTVPMPPEVAGWVAQFIAAHHVERPIIKRKRDRKPPEERWRHGAGPGTGDGRKDGEI